MRHDRRRKLSCQQVPFSWLQAGASPIHPDVMGLPFKSNASYQMATLLQRSGTTNVKRDTFHREVKYSLFCILDLRSYTITKYSPLTVERHQKYPSFTVIRKPPGRGKKKKYLQHVYSCLAQLLCPSTVFKKCCLRDWDTHLSSVADEAYAPDLGSKRATYLEKLYARIKINSGGGGE